MHMKQHTPACCTELPGFTPGPGGGGYSCTTTFGLRGQYGVLTSKSANQSFHSVELAAAARNETREKEIQDEHSGGTARGLQACLRCGGWRALSGSRHGRMIAQIITHWSGDGAVGCSRLIRSGSIPGKRSHLVLSQSGEGRARLVSWLKKEGLRKSGDGLWIG